jgi:hypothetical protein
LNQASSWMSASKPGLLLAIIIMAGLHACVSGPISSTPAVSTSIVTLTHPALPTATRQWPTLIPSPTTVVPRVPDDRRIVANIDVGDAPWHMAVANGYHSSRRSPCRCRSGGGCGLGLDPKPGFRLEDPTVDTARWVTMLKSILQMKPTDHQNGVVLLALLSLVAYRSSPEFAPREIIPPAHRLVSLFYLS